MASLYDQQESNIHKTWGLMAVFLIVVIGIGFAVSWYYNSSVILYAAVAFALIMNVGSYWFSDKLVLSMNRARPATREEFFDFYTVTENLCITAGLPMPKLYVIDDPAPNAFSTGRNEKHAVVCATTGLLAMMNRTDLEGVIAHELSHIKNKDMLLMTMAVVLAGFVAIIANIFLRVSFFSGGNNRDRGEGGAIIAIVAIIAAILAPIAAQLIQLAISRKREFLADASGALLTRYPEGLADALQKIGAYERPMQTTNPATAHLFISSPFGAHAMQKGLSKLFMTHPPIEDRIAALLDKK